MSARLSEGSSGQQCDMMNSPKNAERGCPDGEPTSDTSSGLKGPSLKTISPRGIVVLADDEPAIRAMVAMVLTSADYRVIQSDNGMHAAYCIHQMAGQIDALVTDVVMPLVSGAELAVWVRRVWPHIPVLFMSGFYEPSHLRLSADDPAHHFLAKPFTLSALVTQVTRLIDVSRNLAGHIVHDSFCEERCIHGHTNVHPYRNSFIAE